MAQFEFSLRHETFLTEREKRHFYIFYQPNVPMGRIHVSTCSGQGNAFLSRKKFLIINPGVSLHFVLVLQQLYTSHRDVWLVGKLITSRSVPSERLVRM